MQTYSFIIYVYSVQVVVVDISSAAMSRRAAVLQRSLPGDPHNSSPPTRNCLLALLSHSARLDQRALRPATDEARRSEEF